MVGRFFGPIMGLWFAVLAVSGLGQIIGDPEILKALSPSYGLEFFGEHFGDRLHRARGDRPRRHRRRGAVRRHGPLRPAADPPRLVPLRLPGADPQLPGPGIADPAVSESDRQPVLPPAAALVADPDGRAGDDGDRDRLAGGDLGRLLGHPPGGAARLPAPGADPPHLARGGRPGLRAGGQPDADDRRRRPGHRLRLLRGARLGLRDRRHRHAGDRHDPLLRRRADALAQAPVDGADRRDRLPHRRPRLLLGQRDQGRCTAAGSRC